MKKGIIVGAGIGGLTTHIALAQRGIHTEVYEQAEALMEVGAGIWVAPNGMKVYAELGLAEDIIQRGHPLNRISVVDMHYQPISVINGDEIFERHGFKTIAIHRADLQRILMDQATPGAIHTGWRLRDISLLPNAVEAHFEDGRTVRADFIICADGIHSVGRRLLHPNLTLRYSGQTCWRFVCNLRLDQADQGLMYEIWSNSKGLRVGYSHINAGQVYVFITDFGKPGGRDDPGSLQGDLLQRCRSFPQIVRELILSVNPASVVRTDLFDFTPISPWVRGRVALLGDAAHATTPNLGQGACQAIEDARAISAMLSEHDDIAKAFENYQQKRMSKAAFITRTSYQFARITNLSGMAKSIAKSLIRLTPRRISDKQLDRIYSLAE